jgi:hypothetical protein
MPVDLTALNAAIAAATAEITRAEGLEDSATALITNFAAAVQKAVADALAADAAANADSIAAATKAINDTRDAFVAKNDSLAAALAANPGT